ncbi:MAG: GNAT family N-acetyltransferase [Solirubrobacteraceae bacterium]
MTTRRFDDTGRYVVLVAHERRRLVGSTVFYFVDTLDDEQTDIHEIVGPGSIGPFFAEGDERWGGHAIVMDSVWVAPDRRRAGIATAMVDLVAQIGLPAGANFAPRGLPHSSCTAGRRRGRCTKVATGRSTRPTRTPSNGRTTTPTKWT